MRGIACTFEIVEISQKKYCRQGLGQAYKNNRDMEEGVGGWTSNINWWWGGGLYKLMPINVNAGGKVEVMST